MITATSERNLWMSISLQVAWQHYLLVPRSSHFQIFFEIGIFKNFAIFWKIPALESHFNKVSGLEVFPDVLRGCE